MALKGPKYFSRGLRHLLDQVFESDPLLDRALTSVIIPAFDTKLQQPILFSSWQVSLLTLRSFRCNVKAELQSSMFCKPN